MVNSVQLLVHDRVAADLKVCGLTVLERNVRSLTQSGFAVNVCSLGAADASGALVLRGDCQYPLDFAERLAKTGDTGPEHDVKILLEERSPQYVKRFLENRLFQDIHDKTEGWIARGLNKKVSFAISRILTRTPITPNTISIFCFLVGIIGCLGFLSSRWGLRILGAILLQLSSILDGCDGEVARLKLLKSKLGAWLDTVFDDVIKFVMFICLYVGYDWQFHNGPIFKFCVVTSFAYVGVSFVLYHYLITHKTAHMADFRLSWQVAQPPGASTQNKATWFDHIKPILKHDSVLFIAFIMIVLDLRIFLLSLLAPTWIAFFLYMASFFHTIFRRKHVFDHQP